MRSEEGFVVCWHCMSHKNVNMYGGPWLPELESTLLVFIWTALTEFCILMSVFDYILTFSQEIQLLSFWGMKHLKIFKQWRFHENMIVKRIAVFYKFSRFSWKQKLYFTQFCESFIPQVNFWLHSNGGTTIYQLECSLQNRMPFS